MNKQRNIRDELVQDLRDIQSKHTYFLMASAGASLAFGVQKIDGQTPGFPLYVGLAAMALWILSFAFGCMVITGTQALLSTNMELINQIARAAFQEADITNLKARKQFRRVNRRHFYQFAALALGVVLFAGWRVLIIFHPSRSLFCIP